MSHFLCIVKGTKIEFNSLKWKGLLLLALILMAWCKHSVLITFLWTGDSFCPTPPGNNILFCVKCFSFLSQKHYNGSCFFFPPLHLRISSGMVRRLVRVVEQFWSSYPLKGPRDILCFYCLGHLANLLNRELCVREKEWGFYVAHIPTTFLNTNNSGFLLH